MTKSIFILIIVGRMTFSLMGQDTIPLVPESLLEDLAEDQDEQTFDFYSLYEDLQIYVKNPININTATREDFESLQILTDRQITDILTYRRSCAGQFLTKYELQVIPSLDMGTIRAMMPFVTVGKQKKNITLESLRRQSSSSLYLKYKRILQTKKGFSDGKFLGDPNHFNIRYKYAAGRNVRIGLLMEKDPGEEFFTGSNKSGFDYYSGYIHLRDLWGLKTLHIGDYTVSMGQGLILHNSFSAGKTSFVTNIKKGGRPIRAYGSVNENNFFRGVAVESGISRGLSLTAFASSTYNDAVIRQDTSIDTGFETVTSIRQDGLHRTIKEIESKHTLGQVAFGSILKYRYKSAYISTNFLQRRFSTPFTNEGSSPFSGQLYKKYGFSGDRLTNVSVDFGWFYRNIHPFGEIARSDNGGLAFIGGLLAGLGRNIEMAISYRNYSPKYQVIGGRAFGESTRPINEKGVYAGLKIKTGRFTHSGYFDIWKHPWLKFQKDAPSAGREFLYKSEYYIKRKFKAYIQYRYEEKMRNARKANAKIDPLATMQQHRIRFHIENTVNRNLKLRNRLEYVYHDFEHTVSQGFMIYQDIIYKPLGGNSSFTARMALFDTDGFDSRIYAYENDILYEFAIPFFTDKGSRFYINWRQRIGHHLTLEGRYARTYYTNKSVISSGSNQINGNVLSEVKFQLKYKF